jgi:hypothetical protein
MQWVSPSLAPNSDCLTRENGSDQRDLHLPCVNTDWTVPHYKPPALSGRSSSSITHHYHYGCIKLTIYREL